MQTKLLLFFIIALLQGCVALPTLDKERATSLTDIYIVPIKKPFFSNSCKFCTEYEDNWYQITTPYIREEKILFDASLEVAEKTKHYLESEYDYTIHMASETVQMPGIISWEEFSTLVVRTNLPKQTRIFNLKAASYIHSDKFYAYISLWHDAGENWRSEKNSSLIYPENPDFDTTLEIVVRKADSSGRTYLPFSTWINMKLVDTQSRKVLAISSCAGSWPSIDPTIVIPVVNSLVILTRNKYFQKVLTGEGANTKEVFLKTVNAAVPECIEGLGLQKK